MKTKNYISLILLMLFSFGMKATHIVGGEVYYDYLGNNDYRIVMKVYRDCINGVPNFDGLPGNDGIVYPCTINIFDAQGVLIQTIISTPAPKTQLEPNQPNPCIEPPNNICYEEAVYTEYVNLPPKTGGYTIVYKRCCRNNSILNLIDPGGTGATYWEHIPGPEEAVVNSSPRFNNFPPIYICNGIPIEFDHGATDPDGDQLVYSICSTYSGLDRCCPLVAGGVNGGAGCPASCPTVNSPPPFGNVNYLAPYSGSYPMSSNPAMNINPTTGFLNGIPNINGQWVVSICVQEIRNGVVIGTHTRDFQFNVTPCNVTSSAAVAEQTTYCSGYNVDFNNLSFSNIAGPTTYSWDFGVPSILSDTSHEFEPTYVYPDTGRYTVQLIVNEGSPCSDTTELDFLIYPVLDPSFNFTYSNACINSNSFDFVGSGTFAPYATFDWNFGPSAIPQTSTSLAQNNVQFFGNGPFPVTLTMTQAICSDSATQQIMVYPPPTAYFPPLNVLGCQPQPVQFVDSSNAGTSLTYLWLFGDGQTSTEQNPYHVYEEIGIYDVTLIVVTTNGCLDTSVFNLQNAVEVKPSPTAGFIVNPTITTVYDPIFYFTDTSFQAVSTQMIMGDEMVYNYTPEYHYYEDYGEYEITQIAYGSNGCPDTFRVKVKIQEEYLFYIPNAFTPNGDYINNVFKPELMGVYEYEFYVFDRWGEKIFETNDQTVGWDGKLKGNKCQQDVYVYLIKYRDVVNHESHRHSGTFSLIR